MKGSFMDISKKGNDIVISGVSDFYPKHIFECGQCFRWEAEEDGSYTAIAFDKVINVSLEGGNIILKNSSIDDVEKIWISYFDLDTDYSVLKEKLSEIDEYLKASAKFGYGIRILRQDFHEMIISFIISARNSIPMIKKSVESLSQSLGEHIDTFNGKKYYSFPTMQALRDADLQLIRDAKTAFRAPYIQKTASIVVENNIKSSDFDKLSLDECSEKLQELQGVGAKVADCIALFGLAKYDAFPVDVWVKRVIGEFYLQDVDMSLPKIRKFCIDKFGSLGGYAQQYLFYYARENGIGKK